MGIIAYNQMLANMRQRNAEGKGSTFSVTFSKFSGHRDTGGQLVHLESARLASITRRADGSNPALTCILPNGQIRKFHARLVSTFNGQNVVW